MVENKAYFFRFLNPVIVCVAYLFLYLPIFVLVIFSFNDASFAVEWTGFSLRWYKKLIHSSEILEALQTSLIVACVTTFLSVLIGACFVVASKWWKSTMLVNLFYGNILLPEIIMATGIL